MDILSSQKNVVDFLIKSKKQDRLSHAYLFQGAKGCGKYQAALYFVCMLYCSKETPCLTCKTCQQIINNEFLNLIVVSPLKDGIVQSYITKSDVVNLQVEFSKTPVIDGPRIFIIIDADKMEHDTQYTLLKFIEEPLNASTYGILLTTKPDKIVATIKSRSIVLPFTNLKYSFAVNKLLELKVEYKYANLLPYVSNDISKCVLLLDDSSELKLINAFYDFIDLLDQKKILLFHRSHLNIIQLDNNFLLFINLLQVFFNDVCSVKLNRSPISFKDFNFTNICMMYQMSEISEINAILLEIETKMGYNTTGVLNTKLLLLKVLITLNGGVIS